MEQTILERIFGTPEDQVEIFVEAMGDAVVDQDEVSRLVSGLPDKIAAPEITDQVNGWIRIQSGYHGDDFVWHLAPASERRQFKVSIERVVFAICQSMNDVLPNRVEVKIWLPRAEWDIKEITFKAVGLKSEWSVDLPTILRINAKLFEVLNALV